MPDTWQKAYQELKVYVAQHPSIEITPNCISIPGDLRPRFYRLFGKVRQNFVRDKFVDQLEDSYTLSKNYREINRSLAESLGLETVNIRTDVKWFLLDPLDGLMRVLFDRLFELLNGKIDLNTFERTSSINVETAFANFFEYGYRHWVELSLMKLLVPSKNYRVPIQSEHLHGGLADSTLDRGRCTVNVPDAEETKIIAFEQEGQRLSFVLPRVLMYSSRLGLYVSINSDFYWPYFNARFVSGNVEWLELPKIKVYTNEPSNFWPDLLFYTARELTDLVMVADHSRVMRPDIVFEVMEQKNWYENGGLELVKRYQHIFKPRLGTYVICRLDVPEAAYESLKPKDMPMCQSPINEKPEYTATTEKALPAADDIKRGVTPAEVLESPGEELSDIHLIAIGQDIARLEPVLETLMKSLSKPVES